MEDETANENNEKQREASRCSLTTPFEGVPSLLALPKACLVFWPYQKYETRRDAYKPRYLPVDIVLELLSGVHATLIFLLASPEPGSWPDRRWVTLKKQDKSSQVEWSCA